MINLNVGDLCTFQKFKGDIYWVRVIELYGNKVLMEDLHNSKETYSTIVHSKVQKIPQYVLTAVRDTLVNS